MKYETFVPSTKELVDELNLLSRLQTKRWLAVSKMTLVAEQLKGVEAEIRLIKYWSLDENDLPHCSLIPAQVADTWEEQMEAEFYEDV